ncbi:MAG: hypothetical protein GYB65_14375 [Chloroflexi bacterium]|nr:hypothetical protein [Chloroflexota bacterium]
MSPLLPYDQWVALRRLYIAGKRGIQYDGQRYGDAGPWSVLQQLRDRTPSLMREVTRTTPDKQMLYLVVITEAGVAFYEANERLHDTFYPPDND